MPAADSAKHTFRASGVSEQEYEVERANPGPPVDYELVQVAHVLINRDSFRHIAVGLLLFIVQRGARCMASKTSAMERQIKTDRCVGIQKVEFLLILELHISAQVR